MERRILDISWASLWRLFFFVVLAVLLFQGRWILLGLFLAVVISSGLEFIVNFLERRNIPRALSVIMIFMATALLVLFVIYTVIPLIIVDLNTAFANLVNGSENTWWKPFLSTEATESFNEFITRISTTVLGGGSLFQAFSDLLGGVALALSVLVSAFYLSLTQGGVERFIRAVFPLRDEEVVLKVYKRAVHRVGMWFRAQIVLSLIVGGLTLIGLSLLGVPYAFLLGLVTAILEVVPYIGPLIASALAVIAALGTSPTLALYAFIVFMLIQQIENHILVPLLIGRNTGLHPVIVIMALLIGVEAGGVLGMIVAVPAAVVIQEILEEWSGRRRIAHEEVTV